MDAWSAISWLGLVPLGLLLLLVALAWYSNSHVVYCREFGRMDGCTVVMTGATTGVGQEAARVFIQKGCRLVMGCENFQEGQRVADGLMRGVQGRASVGVLPLDLASIDSVRAFARQVLATETRLDVLVLHHSVLAPRRRQVTIEGLEVTMATNFLGHFLLANLLMGMLKITPHSRVVVTVSQMYSFLQRINAKDLMFTEERYTPLRANALSTLCLVMCSRHLALLTARHGVLVNCVCPGFVRSDGRGRDTDWMTGLLRHCASVVIGRTAEQGAQTLLHLALASEGVIGSGGLFVDCGPRLLPALATDDLLAREVFEEAAFLVQLEDQERRYL